MLYQYRFVGANRKSWTALGRSDRRGEGSEGSRATGPAPRCPPRRLDGRRVRSADADRSQQRLRGHPSRRRRIGAHRPSCCGSSDGSPGPTSERKSELNERIYRDKRASGVPTSGMDGVVPPNGWLAQPALVPTSVSRCTREACALKRVDGQTHIGQRWPCRSRSRQVWGTGWGENLRARSAAPGIDGEVQHHGRRRPRRKPRW